MEPRRCPICDELVIGLDACPKCYYRHARCCLAVGNHAPPKPDPLAAAYADALRYADGRL